MFVWCTCTYLNMTVKPAALGRLSDGPNRQWSVPFGGVTLCPPSAPKVPGTRWSHLPPNDGLYHGPGTGAARRQGRTTGSLLRLHPPCLLP